LQICDGKFSSWAAKLILSEKWKKIRVIFLFGASPLAYLRVTIAYEALLFPLVSSSLVETSNQLLVSSKEVKTGIEVGVISLLCMVKMYGDQALFGIKYLYLCMYNLSTSSPHFDPAPVSVATYIYIHKYMTLIT
jgi:hypothetical protein